MQARPPMAAPSNQAVMNESLHLPRAKEAKVDPLLLQKTGKILVQVWLLDASDATLAKLKELGFELTTKRGVMKMVIGRIDATKIKVLSELAVVKYVGAA